MSGFDVVGMHPTIEESIRQAVMAVQEAPSTLPVAKLKELRAKLREIAQEYGVRWRSDVAYALRA